MSPTDIRARPFLPWVAVSLAVVAASAALNPLLLYLVLPEATFARFMEWTYALWPYGWDLAAVVVLPILVIAWIVICAMAFSRAGARALWLLAEAPLILIPAFAANALILGCSLLGQCAVSP